MKAIYAIIKPFRIDDVREALANLRINGITVCEVTYVQKDRSKRAIELGVNQFDEPTPMVQIMVVVPEEAVENVINVISKSARTGKLGDGQIYIVPVDQVLRVRTGEVDYEAL